MKFLPNKTRVRVLNEERWPLMKGEVAVIVDHSSVRNMLGGTTPLYTIKFERGFQNFADVLPFDIEPVET